MQTAESVRLIRCPSCNGLRGVHARHVTRNNDLCHECRKGNVVTRTRYHNYWLERFTRAEIEEMARAIWG